MKEKFRVFSENGWWGAVISVLAIVLAILIYYV
jgi:hypothetical protein